MVTTVISEQPQVTTASLLSTGNQTSQVNTPFLLHLLVLNSYWPSHAVTAFAIDPAHPTAAPTAEPIQSAADMYFVPAVAGIIVL